MKSDARNAVRVVGYNSEENSKTQPNYKDPSIVDGLNKACDEKSNSISIKVRTAVVIPNNNTMVVVHDATAVICHKTQRE